VIVPKAGFRVAAAQAGQEFIPVFSGSGGRAGHIRDVFAGHGCLLPRWGPGQNRHLPGRGPAARRWRHPNRGGLVRGPGGRNAPRSMGSTGSADSSLGLHEMVRVSGLEGPDWRVSGANTLTGDATATRCTGAHRARMPDCARRRGYPTGGGTLPLARWCVRGQTKFYFVCTTRTYLAVILSAGFPKTGTMLRPRKGARACASGSWMTGVAGATVFADAWSF
jgi:hypothetical protein